MIVLNNLSKKFKSKDTEVYAIKDINLKIENQDIFGIIGLSGAGKSTLIRCMNLLEIPTSGDVIVDGQNLVELSKKDLLKARQSIGMIFQQFNLFMQRTVLDNVCFPLELAGMSKSQARKKAYELLEIVELTDKKTAYPAQLSGGQKQRVAIARALATNPKVLLCDEATSALDPTTTQSILKLLKNINQTLGVTIVIITHEMSVIEEVCQKVAVIHKSTIVESGEVSEIFSNPQSDIAKKLIFSEKYPEIDFKKENKGKNIRVIFDGVSSFEPVISNMVLECKYPVNIIHADTRSIDGKCIGQMILQLPEDELVQKRMFAFLKENNVEFTEVV